MKKYYEAPEIMFEDFSLSTNIAGDCGTIVDTPTMNSCPYKTKTGLNIFMSSMNLCTTTEDDGDFNGICYHVPYDEKSLFNS